MKNKEIRIGRPKKYTAAGLKKAVEDYFASICYVEPVVRQVPVVIKTDEKTGAVYYQTDSYGHIMYREEPVCDLLGREMQQMIYVSPPSIYGLCLHLGIDRATFDRYGKAEAKDQADKKQVREAEEFCNVVAQARGRICAYLEAATEGKGGKGAQFKLERIYGMTQKVELQGGGIEEFLQKTGGGQEF